MQVLVVASAHVCPLCSATTAFSLIRDFLIMPPKKQLTGLQDYLTIVSNRPRTRDVPSLSEPLLSQARNSARHSVDNNDLLEFLGDRLVNLVTAVIIEKVSLDKAHHSVRMLPSYSVIIRLKLIKTVRAVVCNNDTFGRLAYYLHLDKHALLSEKDTRDIQGWNHDSSNVPPKVLADLFEAHAGAVFLDHGFPRLKRWFRDVFEPIIKEATRDYWYSSFTKESSRSGHSSTFKGESATQGKLLDFLEFKRDSLRSDVHKARDSLPSNTRFTFDKGRMQEPDCDRLEVATHFINLCISKIIVRVWPQYRHAKSKAAHLSAHITDLIASDITLSYLASLLSLSDYIDLSTTKKSEMKPAVPVRYMSASPNQLAVAFKATIGWYYFLNPDEAEKWAYDWFKPIVVRAHDILTEEKL